MSCRLVECIKMESASTFVSIESYFPLVDKIVKREIRKLAIHSSNSEELRSYGMEGLVKAADTFDPERGIAFEVYAAKRIQWALYDGIRKMGWFPHHAVAKARYFRKAGEMLEAKTADPAPVDKVDAVHRLSNAVKELAVAYVVSYSEEKVVDVAGDDAEIEESLDDARIHGALRVYIHALPEKERAVVVRFFFQDRTLTEVADEMGVTVSWTSKLLSSGLSRLRNILENRPDLFASVLESKLKTPST